MPQDSGVHAHPTTKISCAAALTVLEKEGKPTQHGRQCASTQAAGDRQDGAMTCCNEKDRQTHCMLGTQAEAYGEAVTNPPCNVLDSDDGFAAGINGLLVSKRVQPQTSCFKDLHQPQSPYVTEQRLYHAGAAVQSEACPNSLQTRHRTQTVLDKTGAAIQILKPSSHIKVRGSRTSSHGTISKHKQGAFRCADITGIAGQRHRVHATRRKKVYQT